MCRSVGTLVVPPCGLLACYLAVATVHATVYLNQWAVQIDGGPGLADAVAADNGFRNLGQV